MDPRTTAPTRTLERLALVLPLVGVAAALALGAVLVRAEVAALVPGAWRVRNWLDPDSARGERETLAHAVERLRAFAREDPSVAPDAVVFVGSSTIERFPIAELFPEASCVNRGIANASARLLARLAARLVPPAPPAAFVVYAGAIDWRASGYDADETEDAIEDLLAALHREAPEAPVLLLAPLPDRAMDARAVRELRALEARLAARCLAARGPEDPFERVGFQAWDGAPFASPSGALAENCSVDELHLNDAGYRHVAELVRRHAGPVARLLAR